MTALVPVEENQLSSQQLSSPLVRYGKNLENVPIDRDAQVTLKRMADFVDELRRSGLETTLDIKSIENEMSKKGLKTNRCDSELTIRGIGTYDSSSVFGKNNDGLIIKMSGVTCASGILSTCVGTFIGWSTTIGLNAGALLGAGIGLVAPMIGYVGYHALKTGRLKEVFNNVSEAFVDRSFFSEQRVEILRNIANDVIQKAGPEKVITLNAQEMTPSLEEISRYAAVKGYKVNIVLPGMGKALAGPKSPIPTLGQVVEQGAPPKALPALPKPDAEQEKWAGGLAGSFNRLSAAVKTLDPALQERARPLLETVQTVQTLCAEVRINNVRIGKVSRELDNVTGQVEDYGRMVRLALAAPEDAQVLAETFSVKSRSLAERFTPDLKAVRHNFEDRQKLLANDLI